MQKENKTKIILLGLARHGKDTVAEILRKNHGYNFKNSSEILLEEVIYPVLQHKYGYKSEEECFEDRVNHRAEWFELLKAYNTPDAGKLGRLIFANYDMYVGLRNPVELEAIIKEWNPLVVWVDAEDRLGITESSDSIGITIDNPHVEYIVDNNAGLEELERKVSEFAVWAGIN